MEHYIYFHITADTHQVFYVGQGSQARQRNWGRAKDTTSRTKIWKNVVAKHGYYIQIIKSNLTQEQANVLEIFWINAFGRRHLDEGYLVNIADGGGSDTGRIPWNKGMKGQGAGRKKAPLSEEHKKKLSEALKGKPLPPNHGARRKGRVPWNKKSRSHNEPRTI